jgi:hypothetical protein
VRFVFTVTVKLKNSLFMLFFIEKSVTIKGAKRALAALGLENGHAAKDIRDLRGLIEAWRQARQTAWQTLIKLLTTGILVALIVGGKY